MTPQLMQPVSAKPDRKHCCQEQQQCQAQLAHGCSDFCVPAWVSGAYLGTPEQTALELLELYPPPQPVID